METISYPVEGIARLVVEQAAGDAKVRGIADATAISISYVPAGRTGEGFTVDGDTLRFTGGQVARVALPPGLAFALDEATGDLHVSELAGPVSLGAVRGDLRLRDLAGSVAVREVDGDLRVDRVADLVIEGSCHGDLRGEQVGQLAAGEIMGDMRAYQLQGLRLGQVHGDLWAAQVAGPLAVEQAYGDVHVGEVAGPAGLVGVHGDLRAVGVVGGLAAGQVDGDADLRGPFGSESSYSVAAHGDVTLFLPAETDLRLSAEAGGRIRSDVQLTPASDGSATFTATLGRGSGRVALHSGGDLRIVLGNGRDAARGRDAETLDGLSERIRQQVRAAIPGDLGERIRQQVQASLAGAGFDLETGYWGFERGPRGRGRHVPPATTPGPAAPPAPPRSEAPARQQARQAGPSQAEQMAILKMLEEGTINAGEAEALLKALSG